MDQTKITEKDIQGVVRHWLGTPPNGYLGSDRGCDLLSLLQRPMQAGEADGLIAKMRLDNPILAALGDDQVAIYAVNESLTKKRLVIQVAGEFIDAPQSSSGRLEGRSA
jgi:hypothetical protein